MGVCMTPPPGSGVASAFCLVGFASAAWLGPACNSFQFVLASSSFEMHAGMNRVVVEGVDSNSGLGVKTLHVLHMTCRTTP